MVTVTNIERQTRRFISRAELESIKDKIQRMPAGEYYSDSDMLKCSFIDENNHLVVKEIAKIAHPGVMNFLLSVKKDIEAMIGHIEAADEENDRLLLQLSESKSDGPKSESK